MALEKGTEEFEMFGEYFRICKKYWDVSNSENYWESFINDMNLFYVKYKEIPHAKNLFKAFMLTQNERSRKLKHG